MKLNIFVSLFLPLFLLACSNGSDAPAKSGVKYERTGGQGKMHFVYVESDPSTDKSTYRKIANEICRGVRICIVMYWSDKSSMPSAIPMTDAQVNSKDAHYNLNKNTNLDRVLICAVDGC